MIRQRIRGYDLAFRIGGDEFVIIMPETTLEEGHVLVSRIKEAFGEAMPAEAPISMSIGLACTDESSNASLAALMDTADAALLAAKVRGKSTISTIRDQPGSEEANEP